MVKSKPSYYQIPQNRSTSFEDLISMGIVKRHEVWNNNVTNSLFDGNRHVNRIKVSSCTKQHDRNRKMVVIRKDQREIIRTFNLSLIKNQANGAQLPSLSNIARILETTLNIDCGPFVWWATAFNNAYTIDGQHYPYCINLLFALTLQTMDMSFIDCIYTAYYHAIKPVRYRITSSFEHKDFMLFKQATMRILQTYSRIGRKPVQPTFALSTVLCCTVINVSYLLSDILMMLYKYFSDHRYQNRDLVTKTPRIHTRYKRNHHPPLAIGYYHAIPKRFKLASTLSLDPTSVY